MAGLVYIAAHMPDAGENEADDGKRFSSDLKKTPDGFTTKFIACLIIIGSRSEVLRLCPAFYCLFTTSSLYDSGAHDKRLSEPAVARPYEHLMNPLFEIYGFLYPMI